MSNIYNKTYKVTDEHSAAKIGSGDLKVLSTPSLIAFMENAAYELCQTKIKDKNVETTVGIAIQVKHLRASAIGNQVKVNITKLQKEGSIYTVELAAYDRDQLIGEAIHQRAIVNIDRFMAKVK
ncbi:thioesterase family protein [Facklamia miroungae]|uniref:Predicted thioesterase n=1 Tax=Facklamia miroungae TaxID=120956 RepID=A0A1G7UP78_9LACT|nr:thioesterase family protein [Facklamia miroungae]NKZ30177.1 thioesterase family protein [Facklamia miroungae]SDG49313.1 Predicted thioesterase [Facklamia miroungae]